MAYQEHTPVCSIACLVSHLQGLQQRSWRNSEMHVRGLLCIPPIVRPSSVSEPCAAARRTLPHPLPVTAASMLTDTSTIVIVVGSIPVGRGACVTSLSTRLRTLACKVHIWHACFPAPCNVVRWHRGLEPCLRPQHLGSAMSLKRGRSNALLRQCAGLSQRCAWSSW